jgi:diguanylate cyclase (GGDEF)-like protein
MRPTPCRILTWSRRCRPKRLPSAAPSPVRRLGVLLAVGMMALAHVALAESVNAANAPTRLTVVQSANWTPYAFKDANGRPIGMLIDLWRLFGERNDVEIAFRLVDWQDGLQLIRDGAVDVHGGLTWSESREAYLDFSTDLMSVRTILFVPAGAMINDLAELGRTEVGVVASSFEQEFLETYFSDIRLRAYPHSAGMVSAALGGEIGAFVADDPTGYYRLLLGDGIGRFQGGQTLFTNDIRAAVREGDDALRAFIDAGLAKITSEEVEAIRDRWVAPQRGLPRWVWPAAGAVVGLLLLLGLGSHYLSLRATVRRKTLALKASIQELETANRTLAWRAATDALTGLANRSRFYERAALEMRRAKRYERALALALLDLDRFKTINDTYGHLAGDAVLSTVADRLSAKLRDADLVARLGGDEFAILLPETRGDEAVVLLERVLAEIQQRPIDYAGSGLTVSFSAGVADYEGEGSVDPWLQRADASLYRSKRGEVVIALASSATALTKAAS